MSLQFPKYIHVLLAIALVAVPALPQDHVVTPAELRKAVKTASEIRAKNRTQVEAFFSSEPARKALKSVGMDPVRVRNAVASLSDEELARLSEKTAGIERDFKAGALTSQELTYAVIALATAVIILVIVVAAD